MDETAAAEDRTPRDWRIWFGLGLSVLWLLLGVLYIGSFIGFRSFLEQGAAVIGGFLEGGFAPLAFLWLVIGYFLQQRELAENTRAIQAQYAEMRRTAEQAEIQARAIQANELHARQDTFIEIAAMVQRQLGGLAGMIYAAVAVRVHPKEVSPERVGEMWGRAVGDHELFSRSLLGLHFAQVAAGGSSKEMFLGDEQRRAYADRYISIFSRLLETARDCDPEGMISEAILGGSNGLLFQILREHRDGIPAPDYQPIPINRK